MLEGFDRPHYWVWPLGRSRQFTLDIPFRSHTTRPSRTVSSASSFWVPLLRPPRTSTNPKVPRCSLRTVTSAGAPTLRCPRSVLLITWAGFHVDLAIVSCRDIPRLRNFDMTFAMSFMPPIILWACRSVLIVSGQNPCAVSGSALLYQKLPPP